MTKETGLKTVMITGGAGFFGELLKKKLLDAGYFCVSVDLVKDDYRHPNLASIQGDIRDASLLEGIFSKHGFDAIFHCAAILAHAVKDKGFLWSSNVDGTYRIAGLAERYGVPRVIFTSSNCLWGESFERPVREDDVPKPVEIYGKSKWEAEKILLDHGNSFKAVIIRCPTIIDCGRLGLLAILFDFIREGRKVWVVGDGGNRYQFIYAQDLIDACIRSLDYPSSAVFNIGSDKVKSLKEVYQYVIDRAGTQARIAHLPERTTLLLMKAAYHLKLSPLGPYQYRMISSNFEFDTSKIKSELGWRPTLTNEEMLFEAYDYYQQNYQEIKRRSDVSAHKKSASMGIIRLLKWIS